MIDLDSEYLILALVFSIILIQFLLNRLTRKTQFLYLFNLVLFFQGITIFLLRSKVPEYLGIMLMLTSGYHILNMIRRDENPYSSNSNIISQTIFRLKQQISVKRLFPYVGVFIILIILGRTFFLDDPFGQSDRLLVFSAITWMGYNHMPSNFIRETDFVFIFFNILIATLILPSFIYEYLSSGNPNFGSNLMYIFLVTPLENMLTLTGYEVWDHEGLVTNSEGQKWGILSYRMQDGSTSSVLIAEVCSGIYSIYIFTSAFAAYVLTEYKKWDATVSILLLIGLLTAYTANLLRMYLIVLVGIYWGGEQLYWAHSNFGWLIFMFWIWLFWTLFIPYLMFPKSGYEASLIEK